MRMLHGTYPVPIPRLDRRDHLSQSDALRARQCLRIATVVATSRSASPYQVKKVRATLFQKKGSMATSTMVPLWAAEAPEVLEWTDPEPSEGGDTRR